MITIRGRVILMTTRFVPLPADYKRIYPLKVNKIRGVRVEGRKS
jgi:hypothetical protein